MSETIRADVLVVGGGPGGYAAAIRAGQLHLDTVLVTDEDPGGTCLLRGCIPSKALIHAANLFHEMTSAAEAAHYGIRLPQPPTLDWKKLLAWKTSTVRTLSKGVSDLLRRANVRIVHGTAYFEDAKNCIVRSDRMGQHISANNVILATGSVPQSLPGFPFSADVLSSADILDADTLPKRIAIIGAGYIGLELGTVLAKFGTQVTILEQQPRILPQYDEQLSTPVRHWLERAGISLHLGTSVKEARKSAEGVSLLARNADGDITVSAEKVLVTIGRRPRTDGFGLENMAIDMKGPFVAVDDQCRTSMQGVWAIGDLTGEPMLAHKASAQGVIASEIIAGHARRFRPAAIPAVCFTEPEIVSVGLSPQECGEMAIEVKISSFPFAASGRAMTMGSEKSGGFVRIVARKDNHQIVGIQASGQHISELAGEFALALEMGSRLEDLGSTIHAHPTLAETVGEAALRGLGSAIHI